MLVSLKPLMEDAMKKGYAVGAFNCPNMESVMAIIQAAEETNIHGRYRTSYASICKKSLCSSLCTFGSW
mgnify:CR=1 FL=1